MFVREYGLVHNPSDPERFIRLLRWEERWVLSSGDTPEEDWEEKHLVPTVWEYQKLDTGNPRSLSYTGPELRWVPVMIQEHPPRGRWQVPYPSEAPTETETTRRERIRALRRACHVDLEKGAAEPQWMSPARLAEEKARNFAQTYGREAKGYSALEYGPRQPGAIA